MSSSDVELGAGDSIGRTVQFLLDCKEKGQDLGKQRQPSIFKVPSVCRDLSPRSFNPRVVSIGPLHRQDNNLQEFEVQKTTHLHHLLDRSGCNPEKMLQECVDKVSRKIKLIKACYAEYSTTYNDEELARMMVIDGCFILDFIHLLSEEDGPFPVSMLIAPSIVTDLVIIENQIPFFVLQDIFESTILQFKPVTSLTNHIKILLRHYNIFGANLVKLNVKPDTTHDHILGLLHKCFQPVHDIPKASRTHPKRHMTMDLYRAGVNFRPNQDANWAMAMRVELPRFSCFPWGWCKPTLRMPRVTINDETETILRNLIIYEQSSLVPNYVTSYACALDMLIDTPEDVAKLVKSGVIANKLCSNENAVDMINRVCTDVALLEFFYQEEWQELDTYYNSYWPNAAAGLRRTFFSSPWNMIALFAGVVLFVLTIVQTIFTIKAANPIIVTKY